MRGSFLPDIFRGFSESGGTVDDEHYKRQSRIGVPGKLANFLLVQEFLAKDAGLGVGGLEHAAAIGGCMESPLVLRSEIFP